MSELIVIAADGPEAARRVRDDVIALRHVYAIETEDLVVIDRDADGKVRLQQPVNMVTTRALGGAVWGLGLGAVFLAPLIGAAVGAATGALTGYLSDVGIDDNSLKDFGLRLAPGRSAVALLARRADPEALARLVARHGGDVIRAALSPEVLEAMPGQRNTRGPAATHVADFRAQPGLVT